MEGSQGAKGSCGEFIASRAAELEFMFNEANRVQGNARAMQRLPRHMRRRAASHNVKRLPANIRAKASREVLTNAPNKGKMPSRKHRRRPKNLMADYQRRQRANVWLETHIWHAKRFHMTQHWGYRLADFPNDKGWRACQRALAQYCIMWDMSYMCCIEIRGPEEEIVTALRRLISEDAGLTIGAKIYLDGRREGSAVMYAHDAYPFSAIGPVSFIWRPQSTPAVGPSQRYMWLWVHPSCFSTVMDELAIVFQADRVVDSKLSNEEAMDVSEDKDQEKDNVNVSDRSASKQQEDTGVKTEESKSKDMAPECMQKKTENASPANSLSNPEFQGSSVSFKSLKDTLCRYRLLGPKALSILQEALKQTKGSAKEMDVQENVLGADEQNMDTRVKTKKYWWQEYEDCTRENEAWEEFQRYWDPSMAPRNSVLGITVRDPRLFIPEKITNTEPEANSSLSVSRSSWRCALSESPLWETHVRNEVKESKITEHELNNKRSGKLVPGSIPDLGLSESRIPLLLIQQCASTLAPYHGSGYDVILPAGWGMPFWIALVYRGARVGGLKQLQQVDRELGHAHFVQDYPDTAAGQQWQKENKEADLEAYNKRPPAKRVNYEKLGTSSHAFAASWQDLFTASSNVGEKFIVLRSRQALKALHKAVLVGNANALPEEALHIDKALIPVRVTSVFKGVPSSKSAICVPSDSDLKSLKTDRKFPGPSEPIHHLNDKKEVCPCSRMVVGYVSEGDVSLSIGKGRGLGFITYMGLKELLGSQTGRGVKVLVRGITETLYRFYTIEVVF